MNIDQSWLKWAAQNAAAGVTAKQLSDVMTSAGIDKTAARVVSEWVISNPLLPAMIDLHKQYQKLASVMGNIKALQKPDGVEKIKTPDEKTFIEQYWMQNRPVVLTDLSQDWTANNKWTLPYLAEQFGAETIEIQERRENDPLYELNSIKHKAKITVKDFVERIGRGPSNDFYMTANNHVFKDTSMSQMLDDIGSLPSYVERPEKGDGKWHLWVGPAGTVTPLHHDENLLLHTQITGRKRWKLISPMDTPNIYNNTAVFSQVDLYNIDYSRFPLMKNVNITDVVLEPGDTLFLPLGWWHGVEALEPSISVSFTSFKQPNSWTFNNP